jgi:hypothetical protein
MKGDFKMKIDNIDELTFFYSGLKKVGGLL